MALSLHPPRTASSLPNLLPSQSQLPNATFRTSKPITSYCYCPPQSTRVNATKTKRKPRPSFYDQVRDKWSQKQISTRDKFPWQRQQQQQEKQQQQLDLNEEGEASGESKVDVSSSGTDPSASFTLPNRLIVAPWVHGSRPRRNKFDSLPQKGADFENGFFESGEGSGVRSEFEEKGLNFDSSLVEFALDEKESEDVNSLGKKIHGNEEESASVGYSVGGNSGSIELPWKGEGGAYGGDGKGKRKNTELAERLLPEHELKRLRNVALRMLERIKVGAAGVTQALVDEIHQKWKVDEVVKLNFEEPFSSNMKRTHELLESRTGGLVIWRSGSSVVLYRGIAYKFECVKSYTQQNGTSDTLPFVKKVTAEVRYGVGVNDCGRKTESYIPDAPKYLKHLSQEEVMDLCELNLLLDGLGPRFKDWCGSDPIPVDADLLPTVVRGYEPPLRVLPHGIRHCLKDKEMTLFRRLARRVPPHFALGRNRELQGLANAMVKLWEQSAIAKIAIKRGVQNTRNMTMAEELKRLTGGTLLSRNKEFIVFYRGNDFVPPAVKETLKEREKLTYLQHDEEERVRKLAPTFMETNAENVEGQGVADTLTEAAASRWGNQPSSEGVEEMIRDSALARLASLLKHLKNKLGLAKGKLKKSEKALAKLEKRMELTGLTTDLEALSDEERSLFRKIGLSMKPYFLVGIRGVFDGTIENMHLHWKYREVVKIIVRRKTFEEVKDIAISLEVESGGVLVSVDRTSKGYAIILYRGKNYLRPGALRPMNLLTRRQALARSIELQRLEALQRHVTELQGRIELLKSELEKMEASKKIDVDHQLYPRFDDAPSFDSELEEDEGQELYSKVYNSSNASADD